MKLLCRLLCTSCVLLSLQCKAQFVNQLSLDAIRVGIDPIRSWSMLMNADKHKNRPMFFNFVEGYAEFLVHLRTSVVLEAGYSNSNWNLYKNTFYYNSKGWYGRFGLDFNLTEPDPNFEVDLGWRLGFNSFTETSQIVMKGDYWGTMVNEYPMYKLPGSTYWGEILLDLKVRLFKRSERTFFKNLWFHSSVRVKLKQGDLNSQNTDQYYWIPGYGLNHRIMPGINFTLSYFIKIRERRVYQFHHAHDNRVLINSLGR